MDNAADFLLDSNWLVTLSSILVTIYVFVLGVPVLIQQTFLPEKLREVANLHNHFKDELRGLKRIGVLVILFVLFLGNPAWKYVYYNFIQKDWLPYLLMLLHCLGVFSFVFINLRIFKFFKQHVLQVQLNKLNPLKTLWYIVRRKPLVYTKPKEVVFVRLLDTVKNSALEYTGAATNPEETNQTYVVSLLSLAQVCEDNISRAKLLTAVTQIIENILKHEGYQGDWASPIIANILADDLSRNMQKYSGANFMHLIAIAEAIASRFESANKDDQDISGFDLKETEKLLTTVCGFLSENIGHQGYDVIFARAFRVLKRVSASYYGCYVIQKAIFKRTIYECLLFEMNTLMRNVIEDPTNDHLLYYMIAYIAWLNNSKSISSQSSAQSWLQELETNRLLLPEKISLASIFFQQRIEFETSDAIMLLMSKNQ